MKKYKIHNLDCPNCASSLEKKLKKLPFIKDIKIDFAMGAVFLDTQNFKKTQAAISEFEPSVSLEEWGGEENHTPTKEILFLGSLLLIFGLCFLLSSFLPTLAQFCLYALYLVAGIPVFKGSYRRLKNKEIFDENFLMLFATIAAFCINAQFEAVAVMLFFRIGEFFEHLAVRKSRSHIQALLDLNPAYAWKKQEDGSLLRIPPQALQVKDRVLIKVGEKVPSDGVILKGESELEEKAINGEAMPRFCKVGDCVFGGSINLVAALEVEITKPYEQSSIAQIISLVERASQQKSRTEKRITAFAKIYTPCVFFLALLLALVPPLLHYGSFEEWIYRALVVLMVSCPCALVLSVPLGYFGGIGGASQKGILIKGSNFLEALAELKFIAFDKTGTLTKGEFEVVQIIPYGPHTQEELLRIALCAEHLSNHPIAQSLHQKAKDLNLQHEPTSHEQIAGKGMNANCCGQKILVGNLALMDAFGISYPKLNLTGTIIHIALNGDYIGCITLQDSLRENAKETIQKLHQMGIKTMILSGDQQSAVQALAQDLQIPQAYGELLPQDKLAIFEKHKIEKSAFIGDGINDAPVLASADVGISMGRGGSDLSKESADVILVQDDLSKIIAAIEVAQKTRQITSQNIALALGVKGVFILLGIFGIAGMWEAVFGDVGVALLALLNASRVLK